MADFFRWCSKRNVRRLEQLNPTMVPVCSVKLFKENNQRVRFLTNEEVELRDR